MLHSRFGYAQKLFDPVLSASFNTMPRSALAMEKRRSEMSEELRVLYVAMTRATQKLIMLATPSRSVASAIAGAATKLAGQREISPFAVRSVNTLSDWLVMCALLHPDGEVFREYAGVSVDCESQADFRMTCRVIDTPFDDEEKELSAENTHAVQADGAVIVELQKHADFRYSYEGLGGLPVKVAASALAHRLTEKAYDRHLDRPAFLQGEKLTSAEKGTALHAFMQYADFAAAREDIEAQLRRLTDEGYLTQAQADSIDMDKAKRFIDSELVTRCLHADAVYKEYRFNVRIPAKLVDPAIEEALSDETVILQGAVDLAFVEDGKLVIVDYKTDRVKDPDMLKERYASQLLLYKGAMEECLGIPVKECLIYSIYHSKDISVFQT